ncbi:MAG TPA: hypothetical protein VGQ21_16065 [Thermoanaerobaculia bacterium]|jgi:hypothetical protein|nr:hypothetical protein [Thermoanaerobaculia bacterium]
MRTTLALTALLFLAAADPRQPILGHWTGSSKCTAVRPACHDEIASYYIKPGPKADVVTMVLDKVVNGKEEWMGTDDFHVDFEKQTLNLVMAQNGSVWTFTWSGDTMTGTAKEADGRIIRNIRLTKQAK